MTHCFDRALDANPPFLSLNVQAIHELSVLFLFQSRITRDGCGTNKLCLGDDGCDPAGNVLCSFISAQVVNTSASDVTFELFGNSTGYIALVLSTNVTQVITLVNAEVVLNASQDNTIHYLDNL